MEVSTIGLDLAKNVFQVHGVDKEGIVVVRKVLWTCNGFVPVTSFTMPPWLRTRGG
jgi:hypothetical protein